MSAFQCGECLRLGKDPIVRYRSDQYQIEVAAKSADGQDRAKQVSTLTFCKAHATSYVLRVAAVFGRRRELPPEMLGDQSSFFVDPEDEAT